MEYDDERATTKTIEQSRSRVIDMDSIDLCVENVVCVCREWWMRNRVREHQPSE